MIVDLRSDTVTKPTADMLDAMQVAEVGDDVFEEDPSVNALEVRIASLFGKEKALFCPSGTMTNQIAIKLHTQPGDEVICDQTAHIYNYEGGGLAFNSGVSSRLLTGDLGRFTADQVKDQINVDDIHFPNTSLISIENTVNKGGGSVWCIEEMQNISQLAKQHQLAMHLDGARVFNALELSGDNPKELGTCFDTISVCFSKGLGAPVGSVLIGSDIHISKAKRIRKVFGGAMRQAGYLAAACNYALDHNIARLNIDHAHAKVLADLFADKEYVRCVTYAGTNIVIIELNDSQDVDAMLSSWKGKGVLAVPFGKGKIRFVTHLDVTSQMLDYVASIV